MLNVIAGGSGIAQQANSPVKMDLAQMSFLISLRLPPQGKRSVTTSAPQMLCSMAAFLQSAAAWFGLMIDMTAAGGLVVNGGAAALGLSGNAVPNISFC